VIIWLQTCCLAWGLRGDAVHIDPRKEAHHHKADAAREQEGNAARPNRVGRIPLCSPMVKAAVRVAETKKFKFCIHPAGHAASALIGIAMWL
jgi:hypothetical protein